MKLDELKKLFALRLNDLYSAENEMIDPLPRWIDEASNPVLQGANSPMNKAGSLTLIETESSAIRVPSKFRRL